MFLINLAEFILNFPLFGLVSSTDFSIRDHADMSFRLSTFNTIAIFYVSKINSI